MRHVALQLPVQLTVEPAYVAVELIVKPVAAQLHVHCAAVRALGFGATWCGIFLHAQWCRSWLLSLEFSCGRCGLRIEDRA